MADPTIVFEAYTGGASGQINATYPFATRFWDTPNGHVVAKALLTTSWHGSSVGHGSVQAKASLTTRYTDSEGAAFFVGKVGINTVFSGSAPLPTVSLVSGVIILTTAFRMHTIQGGSVHANAVETTTLSDGSLVHATFPLHTAFNDGRTSHDRNALFLLQPAMVSTGEPGITFHAHSGIGLSTPSLTHLTTWVLQSAFALNDTLHPDILLIRRVADVVGLRALVEQILLAKASSTMHVHATVSPSEWHLLALIDHLTLLDHSLSTQEATRVVASLLALTDALAKPEIGRLASNVGILATLGVDIEAYAHAISTVGLLGTLSHTLLLTLALKDSFFLVDDHNRTLELMRALDDALGLCVRLTIADDTYTAWVMGMDSKAVWSYDNFPFNSFATIGGLRLGCGPDGISQFGGTTDNGQDIDWSIRTGLTNLGDMKKKHVDCGYIGYTSDGTVGISVITTSPDGEKVQYNYTLTAIPSDVPVTNRVKFGRGLESVYYAFQFAGTGPFTLDHARILKLNTSRRV